MPQAQTMLDQLVALNASASLNRWAKFEVVRALPGEVELRMDWRAGDMAQYAGFLHAGLIAALLDTACGFAAYTLVGAVLASHFSMNCLAPAMGESFLAHGRVVKSGRKQVFTSAQLFAQKTPSESKLVATGETILVPIERTTAGSTSSA
ncbi:MAG: PaaI family thioesterase [Burkholderiaceae bacterium]|jgi:uncharacterized protein (TIGR00369 family)